VITGNSVLIGCWKIASVFGSLGDVSHAYADSSNKSSKKNSIMRNFRDLLCGAESKYEKMDDELIDALKNYWTLFAVMPSKKEYLKGFNKYLSGLGTDSIAELVTEVRNEGPKHLVRH